MHVQNAHTYWTIEGDVALVGFHYSGFRPLADYDEVARELSALAEEEGLSAVVLNLQAYEHLPSRFLGVMVALQKELAERGCTLAACRLRPEPQRVFEMARLDELIPEYTTEDEAREALGRWRGNDE